MVELTATNGILAGIGAVSFVLACTISGILVVSLVPYTLDRGVEVSLDTGSSIAASLEILSNVSTGFIKAVNDLSDASVDTIESHSSSTSRSIDDFKDGSTNAINSVAAEVARLDETSAEIKTAAARFNDAAGALHTAVAALDVSIHQNTITYQEQAHLLNLAAQAVFPSSKSIHGYSINVHAGADTWIAYAEAGFSYPESVAGNSVIVSVVNPSLSTSVIVIVSGVNADYEVLDVEFIVITEGGSILNKATDLKYITGARIAHINNPALTYDKIHITVVVEGEGGYTPYEIEPAVGQTRAIFHVVPAGLTAYVSGVTILLGDTNVPTTVRCVATTPYGAFDGYPVLFYERLQAQGMVEDRFPGNIGPFAEKTLIWCTAVVDYDVNPDPIPEQPSIDVRLFLLQI